jgi:hypothetical protein
LAAAGPVLVPIAVVLLGLHYYYANKVIGNKTIVWGGFALYFAIVGYAKGMDWG